MSIVIQRLCAREDIFDVTVEDVREVFWLAMDCGYASDKKSPKINIQGMSNYKGIQYAVGNFYVLDAYCVTPLNDLSAGFTTIWFKGIPVWTMSYSGSYPKEYIAFLKQALRCAYDEQLFVGGRGPMKFEHPNHQGLFYVNNVEHGLNLFDRCSSFENFSGVERIFRGKRGHDEEVGHHRYQGIIMI